jgi:hypothetical protein
MAVEEFPSRPRPFDAFTSLTDGLGKVTLDLVAVHLDTDRECYAQTAEIDFPDPLRLINMRLRIRTCSFDAPGSYQFTLSAEGVEIAQRRLQVYLRGEES